MGDKVIHSGFLTLVKRDWNGKEYEVVTTGDAAVIMHIDPEDYVYMVEEYRPAVKDYILGFPAEKLDKPGLTPRETILEGLEEECGIISDGEVEYVGGVYSSTGCLDEMVHLFISRGEHRVTEQKLEPYEAIEVVKLPFSTVFEMWKEGGIEGAKAGYLIMYEKLRRIEKDGHPDKD